MFILLVKLATSINNSQFGTYGFCIVELVPCPLFFCTFMLGIWQHRYSLSGCSCTLGWYRITIITALGVKEWQVCQHWICWGWMVSSAIHCFFLGYYL